MPQDFADFLLSVENLPGYKESSDLDGSEREVGGRPSNVLPIQAQDSNAACCDVPRGGSGRLVS